MDPKLYCFACMQILETEDQTCHSCGHDNRIRLNGKGQLPFSMIKNRYLIGKALGRGGFGVTYMGLDLSLDRLVAIKEYFPTDLVSRESGQSSLAAYDEGSRILFEQGRERSMQEARMIARLNDVPDTVNVHDVFIANDTLYIVMEYIEGETLRARIRREGGKLAPETVLSLLKPIVSAMIEIHRRGIIHRDISPDNIMFRTSNGRAVLLDFGAAHNFQLDTDSEHSTSLRPGYAPVEQYSKNGLQDARTDEYALCATIYYAITGQKPVASMERAFGDATLVPPSALGIDISPAIEAALMKGLSILAKDRYDDVAALEVAFSEAVGSMPVSVSEPVPVISNTQTRVTNPQPGHAQASRAASALPAADTNTTVPKKRKVFILGLALACIALISLSFVLLQRGNVPADPIGTNTPAGIETKADLPAMAAHNSASMPAVPSAPSLSPSPSIVIKATPTPSPTTAPTSTPTPTSAQTPTTAPTSTPTPSPSPSPTPTAKPIVMLPLSNRRVSAGYHHTVGLNADGTVVAIGSNEYGECNVSQWEHIVAVSASNHNTIGLREDGTVVAVGNNTCDKSKIYSWKNIVAIAAGFTHTLGLKADGTVVATGADGDGQCRVSAWADIVAVAAGDDHTIGLKADGTVVAAGSNQFGQCDVSTWKDIIAVAAGSAHTIGLKANGSVVAVGVNSVDQCDVSDWSNIVAVTAGDYFTIGIKSDGAVVMTGSMQNYQPDISDWRNIVAVSAGPRSIVGITSDGAIVATGNNSNGMLNVSGWTSFQPSGDSEQMAGTDAMQKEAQRYEADKNYRKAAICYMRVGTEDALKSAYKLLQDHLGEFRFSAGSLHTVALREDGTAVASGNNDHGECNVNSWIDIAAVSAGDMHTVGLTSDGTVVATGQNEYGQCNVTGWKEIVAVSAGDMHTVGLKSDGTVVAAGEDRLGQCDVAGWTNIVAVSAGSDFTIGLKSDGTVVAAGSPYKGYSEVYDWRDIVAISAGRLHTVGLKADGTVVSTGADFEGERNVSGWRDIVAISTGWFTTMGLKADGTVIAIGANDYGQCMTLSWRNLGIISIDMGYFHTLGLKPDGTMVAIGRNDYQQCDVSGW